MSMKKHRDRQQYSQGQLNAADEGDLMMRVATDHQKKVVVIDFRKPVKWIALPKLHVKALIEVLTKHMNDLPDGDVVQPPLD